MIKTNRKVRTGIVLSDKMQKTIVVQVFSSGKHLKYNRIMKKATKFKVHDENNTAKIGDTVLIEESRPLSKDKRWRLVKVLKRGEPIEALSIDEPIVTQQAGGDE